MFTGRWFIQTMITVFITMVFIYIIKKLSNRYDIPIVKDIANEV